MSRNNDWPFDVWLDVAVRIYGLSPQDFWAMSLRDWLSLLSQTDARKSARPLNRNSLSGLMTDFPDKN